MPKRSVRAVLLLASSLLLSGCIGHRVKMYDSMRNYVGVVRIRGDDLAVIYGLKRWRIGVMEDGNIMAGKERVGRVDDNGLVRNPAGELIGKFVNKKICVSLYEEVLGFTEEEIAPKPGGAACMMLFFSKQKED